MPDREVVLSEGYLGDVSARSTEELRRMRDECVHLETEISYLRRLAQGRIDLLRAELARRSGEADFDLIEELPRILTPRPRPEAGSGRMPHSITPSHSEQDLERELDGMSVVDPRTLGPGELDDLLRRLEAFERKLSDMRRKLFARIDVLQSELARRLDLSTADD
ncbi:MAG: hypothetical protein KatS3mg008_1211 [Acidimicrobiales bacterium]|nr:MAG: hypothetical protein KatS3mg008_1211 [Acidimicrobiales bacterium]